MIVLNANLLKFTKKRLLPLIFSVLQQPLCLLPCLRINGNARRGFLIHAFRQNNLNLFFIIKFIGMVIIQINQLGGIFTVLEASA